MSLWVMFSAGWLVPLWASGDNLLSWLRPDRRGDSFPHLEFSQQMLELGCLWLLLVLVARSVLELRENSRHHGRLH